MARSAVLALPCCWLLACDAEPPAPTTTTSRSSSAPAVTAPRASTTTSASAAPTKPARRKQARTGTRRILTHDRKLVLDVEDLATMTDAERAAVGYLATTIGTDCDWVGKRGENLDCKLTTALDLGYQCSDPHRQYLDKWLGDDRPAQCVKRPITAFTQTAFHWLTITTVGSKITVTYAAQGVSLQDRRSWSWEETIVFERQPGERLKILKRTKTKEQQKKLADP
ncbi:MAG: hypothetical protein JRI68_11555 [Deltaproteobacteria bacterium]|nr:hypothetical protein [Deltaproteobacteria bacterium]